MGNDFQDIKEFYSENASLWFGKYKNIPIKDVPQNYLYWVKNSEMWNKLSKSLKKVIGQYAPGKQ